MQPEIFHGRGGFEELVHFYKRFHQKQGNQVPQPRKNRDFSPSYF